MPGRSHSPAEHRQSLHGVGEQQEVEKDLLTSRKLEVLSVVQAGTLASISYPGINHSFHLPEAIFFFFFK